MNPVPWTYVRSTASSRPSRGLGVLPFVEVKNIHPRPSSPRPELGPKVASGPSDSHVRGVLWYGVNDKIVMGKRGRFGKYGEKKRLERLKGAQHFSQIASRWPKMGISRSCRGPDGSKR